MSKNNQTSTNEATEPSKEKNKVVEVKAKKKKTNKPKQPNKLVKSLKDTGNELKRITWPKFGQVCKQTGVVLAVVIIFTLVIFGFDRLLSWLTGFLF
jgi:preprotein translocase SecE subunit